jgi:membrane protein YqaA with SNARE-associated domain
MHHAVLWFQQTLVPALGPWGVVVLAFLDSSFLSLPEVNDLLVATAAARDPARAWIYVVAATLGSVAGCMVVWAIGDRGGEALLLRLAGEARVRRIRAAHARWEALALVVPALLPPPFPFKVFVLAAGVFGVSLARAAGALLVARGLRYAAWAGLGVAYGDATVEVLRRVDAWFAAQAQQWAWVALLAALLALAWGSRRTYRARQGRSGRGAMIKRGGAAE